MAYVWCFQILFWKGKNGTTPSSFCKPDFGLNNFRALQGQLKEIEMFCQGHSNWMDTFIDSDQAHHNVLQELSIVILLGNTHNVCIPFQTVRSFLDFIVKFLSCGISQCL